MPKRWHKPYTKITKIEIQKIFSKLNNMKLTKYAFIIFIFLLVSCSDDNNQNIDNQNNYAPGVVISFDDDYVDNWVEVHNILKVYDWKATFFVTRFNTIG